MITTKAVVVYPHAVESLNRLLGDGWRVESTTPFPRAEGAVSPILVILVKEV